MTEKLKRVAAIITYAINEAKRTHMMGDHQTAAFTHLRIVPIPEKPNVVLLGFTDEESQTTFIVEVIETNHLLG